MSVDMRQAALALAKALSDGDGAQQPPARRRRKPLVSTPKAMLIGAGLMAAGQMLVKTRGRAALQSVQHRLIEGHGPDDAELLDDEDDVDEEYDEEPLDDEDELDEDEPLDEEDEPLDEEDEEPRSSGRRASGSGRGRR